MALAKQYGECSEIVNACFRGNFLRRNGTESKKTAAVAKDCRFDQRRRNDNINKICVSEGVGEGENCRKIVQKCCFS